MRYINIDRLRELIRSKPDGEDKWEEFMASMKKHSEAIEHRSKAERAKYFERNPAWNQFYPYLSELSYHHCWYTWAPENSSEWETDHFRPKQRSKDENGKEILKDGYWWLAYHWRNFRLSGTLVNKRRKDRFVKGSPAYGKSDFFPLDLSQGQVAQPGDLECHCERPMLLDPTEARDVVLIAYAKDGRPYPNPENDDDEYTRLRVKNSIDILGLDHTPINRGRKEVWEDCERAILEANYHIINATNIAVRETILTNCYKKLFDLADMRRPYSYMVRQCLEELENDYSWLKRVAKSIN